MSDKPQAPSALTEADIRKLNTSELLILTFGRNVQDDPAEAVRICRLAFSELDRRIPVPT